MLKILAIESATDWLSVALMEGETVVAIKSPEVTRQHAGTLLPTIDELLAEAGWSLAGLDALAVSTGPGSFTSLRIGLATAKGLAFGRALQAVGVPTLEAMALSQLDQAAGSTREVVALLDARRGEWYAGGWRAAESTGGMLQPTLVEGLYSPERLGMDLSRPICAVSPEPAGWEVDFEAAGLSFETRVEAAAARPRADWVGILAARRLAAGEGVPAEALTARYLRRAEAEAKRLGGPVESGELARVDETPR